MPTRPAAFRDDEFDLVVRYATPGTREHDALQTALPGLPVSSPADVIRALVLAGHRSIEAEGMRRAYDAAVAAGEPDAEALAWYRAGRHALALD